MLSTVFTGKEKGEGLGKRLPIEFLKAKFKTILSRPMRKVERGPLLLISEGVCNIMPILECFVD